MNRQVDLVDLIPAQVFAICAAVSLGVVDLTIYQRSFDLEQMHTIAGFDVSLAFLASVAAVGVVAFTNDMDVEYLKVWDENARGRNNRKYDQFSRYATVGMLVAVVGVEFISQINNAVVGNDVLATLVFMLEGAGIWAISWAA